MHQCEIKMERQKEAMEGEAEKEMTSICEEQKGALGGKGTKERNWVPKILRIEPDLGLSIMVNILTWLVVCFQLDGLQYAWFSGIWNI